MSIDATSTVLIDDDTTRVTQWRFAPGAQTGWHRHEYNYVVVPTMDGRLRIDTADQQSVFADMKSAEPYYREAGVEHNVINANEYEYAFIEVEFK